MNTRVAAHFAGASLLIVALAASARAADQPAAPPAPPNASPPSQAAQPPQPSASDQDREEIVVTSTLIRGKGPVGSNVISAGQDKLQAFAAATPNELLSTIPQITNLFNTDVNATYGIAVNELQIERPNLRNLSPRNASSASTLVLFNGNREATAGVTQASIDPDLLPAAAIERVEVVTDGGSAIYGADAVGGVVNFITRKRFDGLKIDARFGYADAYPSGDVNAIAGKDWGDGSAYLAYTYTHSGELFGRDRDWIHNRDYRTGLPANNLCNQPNITAGSSNFTRNGAGFVPGTTLCDTSQDASFLPEIERHALFANLTQDIGEYVSVDARAFYTHRETSATGNGGNGGLFASGIPITSHNFYYQPLGGSTGTQYANFSLVPAVGLGEQLAATRINEAGGNAEVKVELPYDWQSRTLFSYSDSDSSSSIVGPSLAGLNTAGAGTTAATAIDPYDVALTNPLVLAKLLNNDTFAGQTLDDLINIRQVFEGKVIDLPGGDVRAAVGYEYLHDKLQDRTAQNIPAGSLSERPYDRYSRSVNAVFGDLHVPVFGADNALPGIQAFSFEVQGRYDHYSDFGSTFNPKVGATYRPVSWLALNGTWSTSFNAPTPLDQLQSVNNTLSYFPFIAFLRPGDNLCFTCGGTVGLQGATPNLKPQSAETWSTGFDIDPPFVEGLRATFNYYRVVFENLLQTPSPNTSIFTNFPNVITTNVNGIPGPQLLQLAGLFPNGASIVNPLIANGTKIYEFVDFREGNFGVLRTNGLDFSLNYNHDTGFGSVDFAFSGNYVMGRTTQTSNSSPQVNVLLYDTPTLNLQTSIGANIDKFRAQVTWNYTNGYAIRSSNTLPQTEVDAFNTVDLFFKYDVDGQDLFKDVSLTLNINNIFDEAPPLYKALGSSGFIQGGPFTVGRQVFLGMSKTF